jgi:putative RNA 2'-phosphotransferase
MRSQKELEKFSVYMSGVLRHFPEKLNIILDIQGWVYVDTLLSKMAADKHPLTMEELLQIVASDTKTRYSMRGEQHTLQIRCNQGHSTPQVDLTFDVAEPPDTLYHGTATKFVSEINKMGLIPKTRHYVHLSSNQETASNVGTRHGELFMYKVDAHRMVENGHTFYLSTNGVWLVDCVPYKYLSEA